MGHELIKLQLNFHALAEESFGTHKFRKVVTKKLDKKVPLMMKFHIDNKCPNAVKRNRRS